MHLWGAECYGRNNLICSGHSAIARGASSASDGLAISKLEEMEMVATNNTPRKSAGQCGNPTKIHGELYVPGSVREVTGKVRFEARDSVTPFGWRRRSPHFRSHPTAKTTCNHSTLGSPWVLTKDQIKPLPAPQGDYFTQGREGRDDLPYYASAPPALIPSMVACWKLWESPGGVKCLTGREENWKLESQFTHPRKQQGLRDYAGCRKSNPRRRGC